jgi:hypothetical protein
MTDTGNARADASLDQKVDGIQSGPAASVCLALQRADSTAGTEFYAQDKSPVYTLVLLRSSFSA